MDDTKTTNLPPLKNDIAFWGMTATQFFGAFNDNLYKQLVLLICVDYVRANGLTNDPYQAIASALLAIPFVLFSGAAGFLSDKVSKRNVVIACKVVEIFVMAAGAVAFMTGQVGSQHLIFLLLAVLFFMGTQSAFFGPSKYGILPEMLRDEDLPAANGIMQMTTFLAIIFGMALGGVLKQNFEDQLWMVSSVCIGIAIIGTLTSFLLRTTPVASPNLKLSPDCFVVEKNAFRYLKADHVLLWVVGIYMLFWFSGAVVLLAVNTVSKTQLFFRDGTTGLMAACMGIGIAIGCVTCGKLSRKHVRFDLVRWGAWGVFASMLLVSIICLFGPEPNANNELNPTDEIRFALVYGMALVVTGFFAGIFAVPLQVFIQARPPEQIKGRVIGAMGLITWIGILVSAAYYYLGTWILGSWLGWPLSWLFVMVGAILGAVAVFFPSGRAVPARPDMALDRT